MSRKQSGLKLSDFRSFVADMRPVPDSQIVYACIHAALFIGDFSEEYITNAVDFLISVKTSRRIISEFFVINYSVITCKCYALESLSFDCF